MRVTTSVATILAAFLQDPTVDRYGLDLMRDTGLPSGTLYPILVRLQDADWVETHWETVNPAAAGRPARRYYRLTAIGAAHARTELVKLQEKLGIPGSVVGDWSGSDLTSCDLLARPGMSAGEPY